MTVILSTHIVEGVEELCNRLAIIDRGTILLETEPMRPIDELRGRIWRRPVSREELPAIERTLPVISTKAGHAPRRRGGSLAEGPVHPLAGHRPLQHERSERLPRTRRARIAAGRLRAAIQALRECSATAHHHRGPARGDLPRRAGRRHSRRLPPVTLWDVKTVRAVARPTDAGEYEVTLDVVAKKVRADSVGHETETPMDDFVEIGIFAPGKDDGAEVPLYLQRHRIRSGKQTISITVPKEAGRAGIDPSHKLIDRDREDNVVEVKAAEAGDTL